VVAAVAVDMRGGVKGRIGWLLAIGSAVALASRALNLLEIVMLAGIAGVVALRPPPGSAPPGAEAAASLGSPPGSLRGMLVAVPATGLAVAPLAALFLVFARIGIATFGGGIAMIGPIEHEVVRVHGWL